MRKSSHSLAAEAAEAAQAQAEAEAEAKAEAAAAQGGIAKPQSGVEAGCVMVPTPSGTEAPKP